MIFNMAGGGGVEVKRATGTARTNSSGVLTINCGFKPDLVLVRIANYTEGGYNYDSNLAFVFSEKTTGSSYYLANMAWKSSTTMVSATATVSNTGCTVNMGQYDTSWNSSAFSNQNCSWVAIKYTE